MRALKPGGILSVTLWNKEEPPKSVPSSSHATMAAAAADVGVPTSAKISSSSPPISTATVSTARGFTADEFAKLQAHTKAMSFDEIYYPGLKADDSEWRRSSRTSRPVLLPGRRARSHGAQEAEPNDSRTWRSGCGSGQADGAPPPTLKPPRVPSTVLARLAWQVSRAHGGCRSGGRLSTPVSSPITSRTSPPTSR